MKPRNRIKLHLRRRHEDIISKCAESERKTFEEIVIEFSKIIRDKQPIAPERLIFFPHFQITEPNISENAEDENKSKIRKRPTYACTICFRMVKQENNICRHLRTVHKDVISKCAESEKKKNI